MFYHYDIRGSVTAIVKPDGTSVKQYTYDEFGNLSETGLPNSFKNNIAFTGSVKDTSTGLQYMNARYYEPKTGRFITQDSYSGNAYEPWTQHLYSYCGNNPTNMIDPTGHYAGMTAKEYQKIKSGVNKFNPNSDPVLKHKKKNSAYGSKADDFADFFNPTPDSVAYGSGNTGNDDHSKRVEEPEEKWVKLLGGEVSGDAYVKGSASYQWAWDSEGYFGTVDSTGKGAGFLTQASANYKYSVIYGYNLKEISGQSYTVGAAGSAYFLDIAGECISMNGKVCGWSAGIGPAVGIPVDVSGEENWSNVKIYGQTSKSEWDAFIAGAACSNWGIPEKDRELIGALFSLYDN